MQAQRSERHVIGFLAFLGTLLAFGIDVALPAYDEIGATFDLANGGPGIALVGTTYFLGMAAGQLVYGPVSDRFGRRPTLLFGLGLYAAAAIAAAFAPTITTLLLARFIWGLGAASPGVLRTAIARDLYSGDAMARVVTVMMAVFMIGPMIVPFFGRFVLSVADWPMIFIAAAVLSLVAAAWTLKFGETLQPENRRPLSAKPLLEASKSVLRTRVTIGHILAQTLSGGAFFIFLGSSAHIISNIYDDADRFELWFGLSGLVSVFCLIVGNRLQAKLGTALVLRATGAIHVITSAAALVLTLASDGKPVFAAWLVLAYITNACATLITPMSNALALEPMGEKAGTASAILGFITLAGGSLLAAVFDRQIVDTVTPMQIGFLAYGLLSLAFIWYARPDRDGTTNLA